MVRGKETNYSASTAKAEIGVFCHEVRSSLFPVWHQVLQYWRGHRELVRQNSTGEIFRSVLCGKAKGIKTLEY